MVKDRARWTGALAGLAPTGVIAALFAVRGSSASSGEVAGSLALVALIGITAGWIAGPLAASKPRRLIKASLGYAIALIATSAGLSILQAIAGTVAANGFDVFALVNAIVGRASYALVSTTWLLIPAMALGLLWSVVARGLTMVRHPAEPR